MDLLDDDTQSRRDRLPFLPVWGASELAEKYEHMLNNIVPSDIIAYEFAYALLRERAEGGRLLDVGCFRGQNTALMAKEVDPAYTLGVDISEDNIKSALERNVDPRIGYKVVGEYDPIPVEGPRFDAAFAGFVTPTIGDITVMQALFMKVHNALGDYGRFVSLQLNPASFSGEQPYQYYKHTLPAEGVYQDGLPFLNTILSRDPNSEPLSFYDYCWTSDTLKALMKGAGFTNVYSIDLTTAFNGTTGKKLKEALQVVEKKLGIKLDSEFASTIPLYRIMVAEKYPE